MGNMEQEPSKSAKPMYEAVRALKTPTNQWYIEELRSDWNEDERKVLEAQGWTLRRLD